MGTSAACQVSSQKANTFITNLDAATSVFAVMAPKVAAFGYETVTAQFNNTAYGNKCVCNVGRNGDFLLTALLVVKNKAIEAGAGELTEAEAMARYVNKSIVALVQEAVFETATEKLESLWAPAIAILLDMNTTVAERIPAMIGSFYTDEQRAAEADSDHEYMLPLPFSFTRSMSVAFLVSGTLLSPTQISIDTARFEQLAYSDQYNLINGEKVYVTPKQAGATAYPTLDMRMIFVYAQVDRDQRAYIIQSKPEYLQSLMVKNAAQAVNMNAGADLPVSMQYASNDNVRVYHLVAQASATHTYRTPDGFAPFSWSSAEGSPGYPYTLKTGQIVLDGNPRETLQSGKMLNLFSSRRLGVSQPTMPYYTFVESSSKLTFAPGFYNLAATDSSRIELSLNSLPQGTMLESGDPYTLMLTLYLYIFELFRVEGGQIFQSLGRC